MTRTFRAAVKPYVVLTICIGIVPAFALPQAFRGDKDALWIGVAGFAALLFTYFWLSRFRLTITPHSLTYCSLFAGERTIKFSDITASHMVWRSALYGSYSRLYLTAHGGTTRINFHVFPDDAARALLHLAGPNQALQPTADRRE